MYIPRQVQAVNNLKYVIHNRLNRIIGAYGGNSNPRNGEDHGVTGQYLWALPKTW